MYSSEFRQIAVKSDAGRPERLFRASVSAFASLTHATRDATVQLDDLTLPLYDRVSAEALRFASAVLSECRRGPPGLIRRLAFEEIEIAAPLLIRSSVLTEADLIAIVGRHGATHARAIRLRTNLGDALRRVVENAAPATEPGPATSAPTAKQDNTAMSPLPTSHHRPGSVAEAVREKLRAMMAANAAGHFEGQREDHVEGQPTAGRALPEGTPAFARLRDTALSGSLPVFRTSLCDALDIGFAETSGLVRAGHEWNLALTLRGIGLAAEQAFLIVSAVFPGYFARIETIRRFHSDYTLTHIEAGRDEIRRLKAESIAVTLSQPRRGLAAPATRQDEALPLRKAS